ncbi:hypothetical protein DY000_02032680 [Brassica cretica]|uniref:CDT1 Geminin-binding domain-containing protein n=1 Tax=Brassica cretica TaxID=69181 RepID=A0ABQ7DQG4_BRACR|nr:hypothetical protein DY000_02032680 [Brassica cretica]
MSSIENASKKPSMASASSNPESRFSTKTPDKTATLSTRPRDSDKPVKRQILTSPRKPETTFCRFEILDECFNGLVTAIRLLKLKGSLTSIANICPKIEYLTNLCMKPTRHINLNTDATALEDASCGTKYMQLRTVFYSKLVEFYKAHPKDEIPKELLPEPFNFSKKDSDTISVVDVGDLNLKMMGLMFKWRRLSNKKIKVNPSQSFVNSLQGSVNTNQAHECYTALQPSRRCLTMTPDDDSDSVRPTNDLERRPSRTRCLNFDTLEEEDGTVSDESNDETNDDEASDASYDEDSDASYDEISLLHSEEPKAETVKQNLPKLVDVIHKLFRSTNKTVITKEELLHKMIACQIDIMDRKEVEEQLRLMLQLVPDWISETKASFGDVLVR